MDGNTAAEDAVVVVAAGVVSVDSGASSTELSPGSISSKQQE